MTRLVVLCMVLLRTMIMAQDPVVKSFEEAIQRLPKESTFASSKKPYSIIKGPFDVKKSTSLVTPIVGQVDFTAVMDNPAGGETRISLRLEFGRKDGKWQFLRLMNTKSRKDFTELPLGRDMLESGALQTFLADFRPGLAEPK